MNIPNIPSDTIYKFSTVLGVVLIIFSLFYWYTILENKIEQRELDYNRDIINTIEYTYLRNDIRKLRIQYDTLPLRKIVMRGSMVAKTGGNVYTPKFLNISDSIFLMVYEIPENYCSDTLMQKEVNLLNNKIRKAEELRLELLVAKNTSACNSFNNQVRQVFMILAIVLGFILTVWGFRTWYLIEIKRNKLKKKKK